MPAIAVADALRAEGAEVSFVGTRERAEADLVPAAGYEIDYLRVSGLDRRNPLKAARRGWRAGRAVGAARRLLARGGRTSSSGGGYVAGPVGLAAVRIGTALVLTEADSHLGLANRLLAAGPAGSASPSRSPAATAAPTWSPAGPCRGRCSRPTRPSPGARFGIPEPADCVTIVGGSLGARSINLAAFDAFTRLERGLPHDHVGQPWILHVAGRRDYPELRRRWDEQGSPERYTLIQYEPNLGDVLAAADLVVARAGGSVMEIAAAGPPRDPVPYPHATGDHQTTNARWMADGGAAVVIPDGELDPRAAQRGDRRAALRRGPAPGDVDRRAPTGEARCGRADRRRGPGGGRWLSR